MTETADTFLPSTSVAAQVTTLAQFKQPHPPGMAAVTYDQFVGGQRPDIFVHRELFHSGTTTTAILNEDMHPTHNTSKPALLHEASKPFQASFSPTQQTAYCVVDPRGAGSITHDQFALSQPSVPDVFGTSKPGSSEPYQQHQSPRPDLYGSRPAPQSETYPAQPPSMITNQSDIYSQQHHQLQQHQQHHQLQKQHQMQQQHQLQQQQQQQASDKTRNVFRQTPFKMDQTSGRTTSPTVCVSCFMVSKTYYV